MAPEPTRPPSEPSGSSSALKVAIVLALLFVFLVGVKGLGDGFKLLGQDVLDSFFGATRNPFIGLAIGILATTLVQSSSVSTSMIVGLVASPENPLPVENAVPMIMGANIGTTVTNTVVSLAHMGRREEFRRAFAVATCHDFFNFISVAILLPIEIATGFLRHTASNLAAFLTGFGGGQFESPFKGAIGAGVKPIKDLVEAMIESSQAQGIALILICGALIVFALLQLVRVMRSAMLTRVEALVSGVLGDRIVLGMVVGAVVTVMVQSSSITTSLLVPLAAAGLITLQQAFPITVGANIGTTVTAMLASFAVSGPNAAAGVHIALVHLLFNVSGTMLIVPIPAVRRLPLVGAEWIASVAINSKQWALFYVLILFYAVPGLLALVHRMLSS